MEMNCYLNLKPITGKRIFFNEKYLETNVIQLLYHW